MSSLRQKYDHEVIVTNKKIWHQDDAYCVMMNGPQKFTSTIPMLEQILHIQM